MKTFSFYHKDSGAIAPTVFSTDDDSLQHLANNTPPDHIAIEGKYDHLSSRFNVANGAVEDYQPPAPSADHEWNAATKRWQFKSEIAAKIEARRAALAEIVRLEDRSLRCMREMLLGDTMAVTRLKSIDDEIKKARAFLRSV